jgi:hypothetical protein
MWEVGRGVGNLEGNCKCKSEGSGNGSGEVVREDGSKLARAVRRKVGEGRKRRKGSEKGNRTYSEFLKFKIYKPMALQDVGSEMLDICRNIMCQQQHRSQE